MTLVEARLDNLLATAQKDTADIDLFAPIPEREECPICLLPLPLKERDIVFMSTCCGKNICHGCFYKTSMIELEKNGNIVEQKCAFCCLPMMNKESKNMIKCLKRLMKKNNPIAFVQMATRYREGDGVFQSDTRALEMLIKAAELGHVDAYGMIGVYYREGWVVEVDHYKMLAYYEVAAKKGSIPAHQELASLQERKGNRDKSIKHCIVAAGAGDQPAMDILMKMYRDKLLLKEHLAQILRAHQTSINGMKSKDRDEAKAMQKSEGDWSKEKELLRRSLHMLEHPQSLSLGGEMPR